VASAEASLHAIHGEIASESKDLHKKLKQVDDRRRAALAAVAKEEHSAEQTAARAKAQEEKNATAAKKAAIRASRDADSALAYESKVSPASPQNTI